MTRLAPLGFLLLTAASPEQTPAQSQASQVINAAKPDAGLLDHGQVGIVIYALLLVIGFLLLRDVVKEWLLSRAMGKLADGFASLNVQLSRLESTVMAIADHED